MKFNKTYTASSSKSMMIAAREGLEEIGFEVLDFNLNTNHIIAHWNGGSSWFPKECQVHVKETKAHKFSLSVKVTTVGPNIYPSKTNVKLESSFLHTFESKLKSSENSENRLRMRA